MFKLNNLSEQNSIVCQILKELRDKDIQTDRYRFRKNIERIGMIAAYEISKSLDYTKTKTQTPLGLSDTIELKDQPVIATVLRAGIPLQHGVNQLFNQADLAYISAYRHQTTGKQFEIPSSSTKRSILPSLSQVISHRIAFRSGFSCKRLNGTIG